jgi:hypothetical protein
MLLVDGPVVFYPRVFFLQVFLRRVIFAV